MDHKLLNRLTPQWYLWNDINIQRKKYKSNTGPDLTFNFRMSTAVTDSRTKFRVTLMLRVTGGDFLPTTCERPQGSTRKPHALY